MELHKAIKEIVANKGAEMIGNIQIINYLLDYQAFKDKPATKLILRAIIDSGYAENILSLINTTGWETKFKQYQHELIDSCGFKENLTQYVFNSIAYALSLIEVEEELMPSDSEDNSDADNFVNENKNKTKIIQVLDAFKIGYDEIRVTCGPQVTSFEFYPEIGVKLSKIKNLRNEFTAALASGDINIVAPTDKGMVCIEVPNKDRQIIPILDLLYSDEYMNTTMELPLCIGRKVDNSIFMVDLAKMPHLLVAGATGMGKSVGLNVIISSLLNKRTPNELKLVLIDPKQVELSVYDAIEKPYLAHLAGYSPICTTPEDAKATLEAVIRLMEERYTMLKEAGVRNIQEYNDTATERLPYYVVIIDEYGDLIMQGDRSMEKAICRIAQKARAVGIHMIISTQRPDTKIVTGSIKANFPTRIAFRTTTGTDSRVILDRMGAERLTGKGDMLYFAGADTERVQCAYVSTEDVQAMCEEMQEEYADCEETMLPEAPVSIRSKSALEGMEFHVGNFLFRY